MRDIDEAYGAPLPARGALSLPAGAPPPGQAVEVERMTGSTELPFWIEVLRILGALLLAGCIGFEREAHEKAAGLKTHMMVGVGSCLFTLLTIILIDRYQSEMVRADPVRIVSAVTSGVAFLAAGVIIQARGRVRNLTTGGSLWMAGAIGLACGIGEFGLAAIAVAATMLVLFLVKAAERRIFGKQAGGSRDHAAPPSGPASPEP
jgi:putative Mg2+ transporter-C (MgtC) family protein